MRKSKKIFMVLIVLISINTFCFAKYYEKLLNISVEIKKAEPIFKVESLQEKILLDVNKNTNRKRIFFCYF